MRLTRTGLLLSSAFFISIAVAAQQSPQRDPRGVALLQGAAAALSGGVPINDATLTGTARRIAGSDDEWGNATLKVTAAGQSRLDFSFPSGPRSEVRAISWNGLVGSWSGRDGVSHAISHHNLMTEPTWFFPALLVARVATKPERVISYVGRETRDGVAVDHVMVYQQAAQTSPQFMALLEEHLTQLEIFLDAATHLPVAIAFDTHPDNDAGTNIPVQVRYSDYRSVNGVLIPFHVQKFLNNGLVLDIQLQTVSLNTGLAAAAFSVP